MHTQRPCEGGRIGILQNETEGNCEPLIGRSPGVVVTTVSCVVPREKKLRLRLSYASMAERLLGFPACMHLLAYIQAVDWMEAPWIRRNLVMMVSDSQSRKTRATVSPFLSRSQFYRA